MRKQRVFGTLATLLDISHVGVMAFLLWNALYLSPSGWYTHHPFLMYVAFAIGLGTLLFHLIFHTCPLTWVSQKLRSTYDSQFSFRGSYIVYYVEKWTGRKIPRWAVTLSLLFFIGIFYAGYIHVTGHFW